MMSDRGVSFKIVFITSLVMVTSGVDEPPSRYLRLPECISSVVILPHIKQKINVWPNTDLLVGVGFPIEIMVTGPRSPFKIIPFPPSSQYIHYSPSTSNSRSPFPEKAGNLMENIILPEEVIRKKYVRSVESTIPSTILQRLQLYKIISMYLSKAGVDSGEACIKRAICEAAMLPTARDEILAGELISVILKVPDNNLPMMAEYNEARKLGEVNRNCSRYFDCSMTIFTTKLIYGSDAKDYQH